MIRRQFLSIGIAAALLSFAAPFVRAEKPSFFGEAGLQLYSLRESFKKDVPGTLDLVKSYGVKQVELATTYGMTPEDFLKALNDRGLTPVSAHFQYDALKKDLAGQVANAKALGLKFAAVPWIPHTIAEFSEADARKAAADFNTFGEAFAKEGITFAYHPHGYEFKAFGDGTLLDLLMKETDPKFVTFEMDVFWVMHPGKDPVELLRKYPHRWSMMHLKDIRKGAQTGVYTGKAPLTDDVPLGTGMVNWPAVLSAAAESGVKHYFIEDESPTVLSAIPETLKYLETLKAK